MHDCQALRQITHTTYDCVDWIPCFHISSDLLYNQVKCMNYNQSNLSIVVASIVSAPLTTAPVTGLPSYSRRWLLMVLLLLGLWVIRLIRLGWCLLAAEGRILTRSRWTDRSVSGCRRRCMLRLLRRGMLSICLLGCLAHGRIRSVLGRGVRRRRALVRGGALTSR